MNYNNKRRKISILELPKGIYFPTKEDVCSVPGIEAEYESARKVFEENLGFLLGYQ